MNLSNKFSPGYIDKIFEVWYDSGKPPPAKMYPLIEPDRFGEKPTLSVYKNWIQRDEWKERAEFLDKEWKDILVEKQLQSKIEMFERHSEVAREMQRMSLTWLREHSEELTPGTAVRLLVDGIEIEQGSAGLPDALKKMMTMRDEDLTQEIAQLLADTEKDAYIR